MSLSETFVREKFPSLPRISIYTPLFSIAGRMH